MSWLWNNALLSITQCLTEMCFGQPDERLHWRVCTIPELKWRWDAFTFKMYAIKEREIPFLGFPLHCQLYLVAISAKVPFWTKHKVPLAPMVVSNILTSPAIEISHGGTWRYGALGTLTMKKTKKNWKITCAGTFSCCKHADIPRIKPWLIDRYPLHSCAHWFVF